MKKNFIFIAIIGFVMATLTGCGSKSSGSNSIKGENGKEYESYREACRDGDFDAAHKFLDMMKDNAEDRKDQEKVAEAERYIFNNEVNYLASLNSSDANARIIFLLNEKPEEGKKQEEGLVIYKEGHSAGSTTESEYYRYSKWCAWHNSMCDLVLDLAISTGNHDLAKRILPLFKNDAIVNETSSNYCKVHYTHDSKDAAQAKYDEAFGEKKEGVVEEEVQSTPKESKKKRRR